MKFVGVTKPNLNYLEEFVSESFLQIRDLSKKEEDGIFILPSSKL